MRLSGTKLRAARQRAALSQENLFVRSGVAEATINRLEQDKQRARHKTVRALADALGVAPAALLEDEETAPSPKIGRRREERPESADVEEA